MIRIEQVKKIEIANRQYKVIKTENGTFTVLSNGTVTHMSIDYVEQIAANGQAELYTA